MGKKRKRTMESERNRYNTVNSTKIGSEEPNRSWKLLTYIWPVITDLWKDKSVLMQQQLTNLCQRKQRKSTKHKQCRPLMVTFYYFKLLQQTEFQLWFVFIGFYLTLSPLYNLSLCLGACFNNVLLLPVQLAHLLNRTLLLACLLPLSVNVVLYQMSKALALYKIGWLYLNPVAQKIHFTCSYRS